MPSRGDPLPVRRRDRSACLALLASLLVAGAWSAPSAAQEDLPETFEGETKDIHLWPVLVSFKKPSGGRLSFFLFLWHHNRMSSGETASWHFLNWFQGRNYKVFAPFAYSVGQPGARHQGVIPFYFQGPRYKTVPLALTFWREHDDGSNTLLVAPVFHRTREKDGSLRHAHFLNYVQGKDYKILFPLAYSAGSEGAKHKGIVPFYFQGPDYKMLFPLAYSVGAAGAKHRGIIPFYFQGPGYKAAPGALTFWWKDKLDDSDHLWLTPAFHRTRDADGTLRDIHALNYFQGPGYKVLFPLAYSVGAPGAKHRGIVPLYFQGPGYKAAPGALTFWRKNTDGSDTLWATPAFHRTREEDGTLRDMHFLNYAQGPNYKVFLPLAYSVGAPGLKHRGIVPLYFQGPGYKAAPGALTFWWKDKRDDSDHLWVTPAFHRTRNADGTLRDMHALNYLQGPGYKVLFPLAYSVGADGAKHKGVVPFYFQGPDYKVLFPLAYSVGAPGAKHKGVVPLYFQGPGYKAAPGALTFWRKNADGSDTLWATPAFHRTRNADGTLRDMHALNYFQGPRYKVFFPLAYSVGAPGLRHQGVIPFYFGGPGYKVVPPALTFWRKNPDGSDTLWATPLFHRTREEDGTLRDMHALNYAQGPNYKVFFPLAYSVGAPGQKHRGIVPLAFWGPGYFMSPPLLPLYVRTKNAQVSPALLSGWWRRPDGTEWSWITPLFHKTRNKDGSLRHMHALNYFQGPNYKVFLPLAYSVGAPGLKHRGIIPLAFWGPGYFVAPPIAPLYVRARNAHIFPVGLSASWKTEDGGRQTWITPLFHEARNADGTLRHRHFANYFQGPNYKVFFPLAYSVGEPGRKRQGLIPLFFKGPNYKVIPLLLSGSWRKGERSGVVVGPLWWSYRPAPGAPIKFQVLGGLVARDCNYAQGTYRYRILWFIPVGRRRRFAPVPVVGE